MVSEKQRAIHKMRYAHLFSIETATLPPHEFEELCRLQPECRNPFGFRYQATTISADGDDILCHLLTAMRRLGIPRASWVKAGHFDYEIVRHYEKSDIFSSELLLLDYQRQLKSINGPERDEQGRMVVWAGDNKPDLKFASTFPNKLIVASDVLRQFLESSGLLGVSFKPVTLQGKSAHSASAPAWELDSSITLPKLANTPQLMHYGRRSENCEPQPFQGDYSRPLFIDDAPFRGAELHYRKSELQSLGVFDIARTFEHYLNPHPALVISQRFYQHCRKNKIPLKVEPVRIDPE